MASKNVFIFCIAEKPEKINTLRPLSYPATANSRQSYNENSFEAAVVAPENLDTKNLNRQPYHQGHFVVVAVDFGTTFSGYAFSFTRDPENIHMMRKWEGGDPGVSNQKTPTCLLLTPAGEFHSFGFLARDHYHNLDPQEAKNWLYFDKFKMTLHHQMDLNRETQIRATNGKSQPALTIFTLALSYFKKHALQELSDQSATRILNEDIRWVITVPAIWRQPAKQFMRQAAYEAGLALPEYPDQLLIALEPEAASIYCRKLRMNQLVPEGIEQNRLSIFPDKPDNPHANNISPVIDDAHEAVRHQNNNVSAQFTGTRYMVVDCGGGTVDITVHEMTDKIGNLKELYKATGGPHGSVGVDIEFENLMREIFTGEFMDQFKVKRPAAYVDLMIAFEARKRNTSPNKTNSLNINLNFSFIDYYKKVKGSNVETAIRKYGNKNIRWSAQGMLRLEPEAMFNLFRPIIREIIQHIEKVLSHLAPLTIQYLFLVGGFAESQILQHEIKNKFSSCLKVMIPQGVSLAILRGAVLYGLDPSVVCVRRSRMTYGVGVLNRFIRGFHPLEKMIYRDRQEWCADVFDKFVLTDQSIGIGDTILRSYTPANKSQKKITLHIYCTENDDAKFISDNGVRRCGTLNLDLNDVDVCDGKREIQTRMIFGDTEIKISALDVVTQKFVRSDIDFL
uniref:Heat shock 70 kDa protein 12A n=1 Tax=Strigamia maritima TaxID=126957 RepID=T1ISH6_STRMM